MKKSYSNIWILFVFLGFTSIAKAQDGWNWGNDKAKAQENWVLFKDAIFLKEHINGIEPLNWLVANTPNLNAELYKKGAELYETLEKDEKDATLKAKYQDLAMSMYDMRIKNFADEANVLNRKGLRALSYWQGRPEKTQELFDLYTKIVALNKEATYAANVSYLMFIACQQKAAGKINDEQVLDIYDGLTTIVTANISKDAKMWTPIKDDIDSQSASCIVADCEYIKNTLIPKYKSSNGDLGLLKKIFSLMISGKCTSDLLFLEIANDLVLKEPTVSRIKVLALAYKGQGDNTKYYQLIEKSADYTDNTSDKANIYLELAQAGINTKGNALKAMSIDPSKAYLAYTLIGNLYMASGGSCGNANPVIARAVYIAAYNMYQKAGNAQGMAKAQAYFPSKEDIFTYNMAGQTVSVPCIGETVVIPNL